MKDLWRRLLLLDVWGVMVLSHAFWLLIKVSESSESFSVVLICSEAFNDFLGWSEGFWGVIWSPELFWSVHWWLLVVLKGSFSIWGVLMGSQVFWFVLKLSEKFWKVLLESSEAVYKVLECSEACMGVLMRYHAFCMAVEYCGRFWVILRLSRVFLKRFEAIRDFWSALWNSLTFCCVLMFFKTCWDGHIHLGGSERFLWVHSMLLCS